MKTITATFDTRCPECNEDIIAGMHDIAVVAGLGWCHEECVEEPAPVTGYAGANEPIRARAPRVFR